MRLPGAKAGRIGPGLTTALGYVSMAGALSTDMYLPAFPDIARDFGAGASLVQLTLTALLIGSAFGQFVIGSVSDALGRRRTLIVALGVYALCCYLAALSPNIAVLLAVRAVQGFAGSAGTVLARAVVADLSVPQEAVRSFARLWTMIAIGPAVASPLGAWLTQLGGWRLTLTGLAVLATGIFVTALLLVPESLPVERRHPPTPRAIGANMLRLIRDRQFVGWALAFAASYASLAVYLGSSSFMVQGVLGIGPFGYSLTFTFTALMIMLGSWLSGRCTSWWSPAVILRAAQLLSLAAALVAVACVTSDLLNLFSYLVLMGAFCVGCGAMMSIGSALAVGVSTRAAGTGSALLGVGQYLLGAVASPLGGLAGTATALPATIAMTIFPVLGLVAAYVATRSIPKVGS